MNRTKEIENAVDNLVDDTVNIEVKLNNTVNQFLMLANTQFIENRVYEENIEDDKQESETPSETQDLDPENMTKEQFEQIFVPKFSEALRYGLEALEKSPMYRKPKEQVSGDDSDDESSSEEEEGPQNEYASPLPFVIGTQDFDQDDFCGLYEESEESEKQEEDEGESSDILGKKKKRNLKISKNNSTIPFFSSS